MKRVQKMANMMLEGIRLTVDLPANHTSGKVPMLDLAVWKEERDGIQTIRHSFYQKPTSSPLVFHGRGACPTKQKITILGEEIRRRMYNMDPLHSTEERKDVLAEFSQKMIDSGHTKEVQKEIICSGVRRYYRLRLQDVARTRNLYRNQEKMSTCRKAKWRKVRAWFKPQREGEKVGMLKNHPELVGGKRYEGRKAAARKTEKGLNGTEGRGLDGTEGRKVENIETPIFVPFTKESRLKKRLQEVDRLIGEATGTPACRFVERCGGSTIVGLLCRNNPWALQ